MKALKNFFIAAALAAALFLAGCSESSSKFNIGDTDEAENSEGEVEAEVEASDLAETETIEEQAGETELTEQTEESPAEVEENAAEGEAVEEAAENVDTTEDAEESESTETTETTENSENAESELDEAEETEQQSATPGVDFFIPTSENYMILTFKGVINSAEDYANGNTTPGVGSAEITLKENQTTVSQTFMAITRKIPSDYSVPEMRDKDYIVFSAYNVLSSTSDSAEYVSISIGFSRDALNEIKSKLNYEAPMPPFSYVNFYDVSQKVRKDSAELLKYCWRSKGNYASTNNKLYVNFSANTDFSPGENLKLWGNIDMTPETKATPETEKDLCLFYMNHDIISMEKYYEEIAKDGTEFDCELPENYMNPAADNAMVFKGVGVMNDLNSQDQSLIPAYGTFSVKIGGSEVNVSDYRVVVGRYITDTMDVIYIQTIGGIVQLSSSHYKMYQTETILGTQAALALAESEHIITNPAESYLDVANIYFYSNLQEIEQKNVGNDYYAKHCPKAITDLAAKNSSIYICNPEKIQFNPGDKAQIASNQVWTTDMNIIKSAFEITDDCWCSKNETENISCDDFDAL